MNQSIPQFNQLNLVVEDIDAAVAFYQALGMGVRFDGGEWPSAWAPATPSFATRPATTSVS